MEFVKVAYLSRDGSPMWALFWDDPVFYDSHEKNVREALVPMTGKKITLFWNGHTWMESDV